MVTDVLPTFAIFRISAILFDRREGIEVNGMVSEHTKNALQYEESGNLEQAIECYRMALNEHSGKEEYLEVAAIADKLGHLYEGMGQLDPALNLYVRALELYKTLNNWEGIATGLGSVGFIYETKGELVEAKDFYEQSRDVYQSLNDMLFFLRHTGQ